MTKECDCFIGHISGDKIYKSTIDYEVERIIDIQPTFKHYGLLKGDVLTRKQIVDGRRGLLDRFIFCPYCGQKIVWKDILSKF